jgi:hypothetical protein
MFPSLPWPVSWPHLEHDHTMTPTSLPSTPNTIFVFVLVFVLEVLRFNLRALWLQGRHFAVQATTFCSGYSGGRVWLFPPGQPGHWPYFMIPTIAGIMVCTTTPVFFHWDGVSQTFFFWPELAWNNDLPNPSLPHRLGWQACLTTLSYWLNFLLGLKVQSTWSQLSK